MTSSQNSSHRSQEPATAAHATTNHSYKPGTIKHIKLVNFMCHESFESSLGPRVNFVIGPNGSGKSALLTAIVVALGGRATTTSRAKKVSDFVMYGKKFAKITLVIHNYERIMDKGQAFKPEDYGRTITVEKIIYKEDTSRLILKNDRDKKISERKQELDEMLEHFGILINNPICILNQEVSKTFLHSKRPEDKFELFMKATNLEQIEQDYQTAKKTHKAWDESNNSKTLGFRMLDKEYESIKEKIGFLENRSKLNGLREELNQEYVCAIARDNEVKIEELNGRLTKVDEEIDDSEKVIDNRKGKIKTFEEEIELMRANMQQHNERVEETKKKLEEIRNKESVVRSKKVEIKHKLEHSNKNLDRYNQGKLSLEKSIDDIKQQFKDQNTLNEDNERRKMDIARIERELPSDHSREKSLRVQTSHFSRSMGETRTELHKSNMKISELRNKLSSNQANLRRLKGGLDNELRKYGEWSIKLHEEIDNAHRAKKFIRKPVGPIGFHIKLNNPDVAGALEIHLGRNAHAYVCDNRQDMSILSNLFKKVLGRTARAPLIITRSFGSRHDTSRFKAVHSEYKTLLDTLDIENDAIYNAIVDRCSVESILFVPEYSEAEKLMLTPQMIPRNTRCAYTKDCACMYPRTATGGYRCIANRTSGSLFSKSNSSLIKEVEKEISMIEADLRSAENIAKDLQTSLTTQRREYDVNNDEIRRLVSEIRLKEEKLLNLKTTLTVEPQEVIALEEELEKCVKNIADTKVLIEKLNEDLKILDDELKEIARDKDSLAAVLKDRECKRQKIQNMIESTRNSISESHMHIKQKLVILENRKKDKAELLKAIEEAQDKLRRTEQGISGQRPAKVRKTETVLDELRNVEAQLKTEIEEGIDPEELMMSLRNRKTEIESLYYLKDCNLENYTLTERTLNQREEGFKALVQNTVSAVATTFSSVMRTMEMYGVLKIHLSDVVVRGELIKKAKTLEMHIDTNYTPSQRVGGLVSRNNGNVADEINDSRRFARSQPASEAVPPRSKRARLDQSMMEKENELKMTDTRSLSGGERSFSTVAFVLALWHHCASPFKLMDEIDVFMDMVTRRISYNALIRFAQVTEDPGQFIFFSPLELPKIDNSDSLVRVFEMPVIVRKRPQSQISANDDTSIGVA